MNPPRKILIVEDEALLNEMVREILTSYQVFEDKNIFSAFNGKEGLEVLEKEKPDIILTDMKMPVMTGEELIETINKQKIKISTVVMSGHADMDMALFSIKAGVTDLIRKPFQPEDLVITIKNILKMMDLEKQSQEYQNKLIQGEKILALGYLAAGVGHEIHNPNTFIQGNLELIQKYMAIFEPALKEFSPQEEIHKKKYDQALQEIHRTIDEALTGSKRIASFTSCLSIYCRSAEPKVEAYPIKKIIEESLVLTRYRAKEHNIEIQHEADSTVQVNYQDILQIFMNLITNAMDALSEKFTAPARGNLLIQVKSPENSLVRIIFEDNGNGMSQNVKEKCFDPFFTTKKQGKGTGLGMWIIHENIKKNRGEILLESEEGQGTRFTLTLPHHAA